MSVIAALLVLLGQNARIFLVPSVGDLLTFFAATFCGAALLIALGIPLAREYSQGEQWRRIQEAFERATVKWNRAYYCQKDDVCFVPGEPGHCASPDFQRWLTE
jgi:hypothetical protein